MLIVSRVTSFSEWLVRQAFIWGGLACLAFYALVVRNAAEGSFVVRYFAGHEVAYCATALFFVGIAALLIKFLGVAVQFATLESAVLPNTAGRGLSAGEAGGLLAGLGTMSAALQESYLVGRLRAALQYVDRKGSADTLEQQLGRLEDADLSRMHHSYAMVRIILSTIPILGFLGTVIGISVAIGKMDLSAEAMDEAMDAVIGGLGVAFDTTALALSLSMVLLFFKFLVERVELRLLTAVDENVSRQLIGRFAQYGTDNDPHLASVCRMSEQLLVAVRGGMEKQADLLHSSFEEASHRWSDLLAASATTLDEALSGAVAEGLTRHAEALNEGVARHASDLEQTLLRHAELLNEGLDHHTTALTEAETKIAEENRRHLAEVEAAVGEAMIVSTSRQEKLISQSETLLKEMQIALVESAGSTIAQQEQLVKQGDILLRVLEATGQIRKLEESLNGNLNALAGSHNFQQTVAGLSAALQLLSARLEFPITTVGNVELEEAPSQSQAA